MKLLNGDCNHPTKLDLFIFVRKKKGEEGVEWEPDLELMLAAGPYSGGRSDRLVSGNFL